MVTIAVVTVIGPPIVAVVPVWVVAVAVVGAVTVAAVIAVWVSVVPVMVVMIDAAEYYGCGDARAYTTPPPSVTGFCPVR